MTKISPKAHSTLKMIKDTHFLQRDLMRALKQAAVWSATDKEDEKRIAKELYNLIMRELLR